MNTTTFTVNVAFSISASSYKGSAFKSHLRPTKSDAAGLPHILNVNDNKEQATNIT